MRRRIRRRRIRIGKIILIIIVLMAVVFGIHEAASLLGKKNNTSSGNVSQVINKHNSDTLVKEKPVQNKPDDSLTEKKEFVVCVDPGHGAYDRGTQSPDGVYEKNVALKVGLEVGKELEKNNVKVVYTRKDDKTVLGSNEKEDLKKRVQISDENNADIFVSIHCNRFQDTSVKGMEIWCNEPKSKDEELAQTIQDELSKLNYTEKRPIKNKNTESLYVLKNNKATSVLIELGYLSNKNDCKYLASQNGQVECGDAIAKAILEFKENMAKTEQ